jgi:predicted Ser/Thr protein kinase
MTIAAKELDRLREAGYVVEDEIGRGASGVVYLATQQLLARRVALKRVGFDPAAGETVRRRLDTEVAALVALEHPGVVRLMDVQRYPGALWFVMEYVNGPSLRQVLDSTTSGVRPPEALRILEELTGVLDHLASRGIVHRDLKPANVFLTADGRTKVGDFGIALVHAPEGTADALGRLTQPGVVIGTPAYLSPEQAGGRDELGSASDLYSLGVMAYELLVGRVPFSSPGNVLALLAAQETEPPPAPRSIRPELSRAVEAALLGPLAKAPSDRPPSAGAFWSQLELAAEEAWPRWRASADTVALSGRLARGSRPVRATGAQDDATVGATGDGLAAESVVASSGPASAERGDEPQPPPRVDARPPPKRGGAQRWALPAVVFVVAVVGGFLAVRAVTAKGAAGLRVASMSLAFQPAPSGCAVVARLQTNGVRGRLRYEWADGGGPPPVEGSLTVSGRPVVVVDHNLDGTTAAGPAATTVTFSLLSPGPTRRESLPVPASC